MRKSILSKVLCVVLSAAMLLTASPMFTNVAFAAWRYDGLHEYNSVSVKSNGNDVPQPLYYKEFTLLIKGCAEDDPDFVYSDDPADWYYAISKTGRVYGSNKDYKYTLDFTKFFGDVYQLDMKAFYDGPSSGFALDVDFDETKLEICRPDGSSLTAAELMANNNGGISGNSPFKYPTMSADWADSGLNLDDEILNRSIIYDNGDGSGGWADRARFSGDDFFEGGTYAGRNMNMSNLFASNDVSRTTNPNHVGNFSIAYSTKLSVNSTSGSGNGPAADYTNCLNPVDIRGKLCFYELMCPENGLSLGTVYFKLKPGVAEDDLTPDVFTRDLEGGIYFHTGYDNPVPRGTAIKFSGADIIQYYNDWEHIPYAANLEINVLGKERFEDHSFLGTVTKDQFYLSGYSVRMDDNDTIQPLPHPESGVYGIGKVTFTKYYKQVADEIPTNDTPDYDPDHPEIPGWKVAPDGKLPNTDGPGIYFLMVDVGIGDLYRGAKNVILDGEYQTFKIVEARTITAAQLDMDNYYALRQYNNTIKQPNVEPLSTLTGAGKVTIVGYKLTTESEWNDVPNPEKPIPDFTDAGEYNLLISVAEGNEWHGTYNFTTEQDEPVVLNKTFTVQPADTHLTASGFTKTFDGTTSVNGLETTASTGVNNESLTVTLVNGKWDSMYAGSQNIRYDNVQTDVQLTGMNGSKASNYRVYSIAASGTITAKTLTNADISVAQANGITGTALPNPVVSGSLGANYTTAYKVKGAADSTYTAVQPTTAGDYTVKITITNTDFNGDGIKEIIGGAEAAVDFTISATPTYTVTTAATTGGTVSSGGTFESGASVTLTATPNPGYTFDGWYENGVKIPGAGTTYIFTATVDRNLEARFVKSFKLGDPNDDDEINIFDIMAIRDHIFGKSILDDDAFFAADVNGDEDVNIFDIMAIRDHIFGKKLIDG